jgi:ADP-heptose:LPS heptosyltransferase
MTSPPSAATPLRGRYLVKNPAWNAFLRVSDAVLAAVVRSEPGRAPAVYPRRVLLGVGGHLGDAIIASSVIPLLRAAVPDVQLGVVAGSWAVPAVEGHPHLRWIHTVDHWKTNRSPDSRLRKWRRYRRSRARALAEIREVGYDAAVDLYSFYPNMAGLLWEAGIPLRAGYTSGGYGPLYTHPLDWSQVGRHTAEQHLTLLRTLFPGIGEGLAMRYDLPPVPAAARERVAALLRAEGLAPGEYVAVHMGTGAPLREWPREKWLELVRVLVADGHRLIFTGVGPTEHAAVRHVIDGLPGCVDLCDCLDWHSFRQVLASARLVVCVETAAMHVAAAMGTPCVVTMTGMTGPTQWCPLGETSTVLVNPVPCVPCFRKHGCATMACVRDIGVDTVLRAVRGRVGAPRELAAATAPVPR